MTWLRLAERANFHLALEGNCRVARAPDLPSCDG